MTAEGSAFARVEEGLELVLEELRPMEPIFHTAAFGMTNADIEQRMAPEYFEVGASGRRYSRGFILATLAEQPPMDATALGWACCEFGLRQLGSDVYQLTYTLRQGGRVTRRCTLWRRGNEGWQILYHQGTIVSGDDDTVPRAEEMADPKPG